MNRNIGLFWPSDLDWNIGFSCVLKLPAFILELIPLALLSLQNTYCRSLDFSASKIMSSILFFMINLFLFLYMYILLVLSFLTNNTCVTSEFFIFSKDLFSEFQVHICISAQVLWASQKLNIPKMTPDLPHLIKRQLSLSSCLNPKPRSYSRKTLVPYVSKPMHQQVQAIIFLYNGTSKLFWFPLLTL